MDFIKAKLIGITKPIVDNIPDTEGIVAYCARVSNPDNQENYATADRLIDYCFRNGHVSVFETVNLVFEIECPRDISRQILRHRSFSFQEFSGRYAEMQDFIIRETRLQDTKNRQNSIQTEDKEINRWWLEAQQETLRVANKNYQQALSMGIAKEQARAILPEGLTMSRMYMNGTLRSWLHYYDVRSDPSTQLEHREVALKVRQEIVNHLPRISKYFSE